MRYLNEASYEDRFHLNDEIVTAYCAYTYNETVSLLQTLTCN